MTIKSYDKRSVLTDEAHLFFVALDPLVDHRPLTVALVLRDVKVLPPENVDFDKRWKFLHPDDLMVL